MNLEEKLSNKKMAKILAANHVHTVDDLLHLLPRKYKDYREIVNLTPEIVGREVAVKGRLMDIVERNSSRPRSAYARLIDENTGKEFKAWWFGDLHMIQFYKLLKNEIVVICGKISYDESYGYSISSPDAFEAASEFKPRIIPIYKKYTGIAARTLRSAILENIRASEEYLEKDIIKEAGIVDYSTALWNAHCPKTKEDVARAYQRFMFDDFLFFAMEMQKNSTATAKAGLKLPESTKTMEYIKQFPYKLTDDQKKALKVFISNASAGLRNNLLIQGDVGCGKTVVAFCAMINAAENGYQAVLMAPTQLLAGQHYEELSRYAEQTGLNIVYLRSGMRVTEEKKALNAIADGTANIIIGTHSCLSKKVSYNNLGLIVTDEEHKFGVRQKEELKTRAESGVHSISMSATPIPRTIASIVFGEDKEIVTIKTMPAGRIPIQTARQAEHTNTFNFIEKQLKEGHQAYVVCPAIEVDEDVDIANVKDIEKLYRDHFEPRGYKVDIVTGKMKKKEAEGITTDFAAGNIHILISTTVIEVGVNVPNATVMVVEQADRFGLASLHQLRGRVGRSSFKSYCILICKDPNNERIEAMCQTTDGFKIAEMDLRMRGAGNLIGTEQSGDDKTFISIMSHTEYYEKVREIAKMCIEKGLAQRLVDMRNEHEEAEAA